MDLGLRDRVAIVGGASEGIGRATAKLLAIEGCRVVMAARRDDVLGSAAEDLRKSVREGTGAEPAIVAVPCDMSSQADIKRLVARTVAEFGRIDIIVNNAGGTPPQEALYLSEKGFEEAFHFNVTSAFSLTRLAVPHMLKTAGGGSVVNISSAAGRFPLAGFVAYGTAKAALAFMTRILGQEFAPKVRVNAIAVGATETTALGMFLNDDLRSKMEALTPMRRLGQVEDIALGALYLASPASSWVTGKIFEIDGGTESGNWPFEAPHL
jgi:7-alpha-hydroxysteroid dehydrogenase